MGAGLPSRGGVGRRGWKGPRPTSLFRKGRAEEDISAGGPSLGPQALFDDGGRASQPGRGEPEGDKKDPPGQPEGSILWF